MNTAHPASLPPAPRSSGGINRSTADSTIAASSPVKNSHGPGLHGAGGFAAPGSHGMLPLKTRAPADFEPSANAAAEPRKIRRDNNARAIGKSLVVGTEKSGKEGAKHLQSMGIAGAAIHAVGA